MLGSLAVLACSSNDSNVPASGSGGTGSSATGGSGGQSSSGGAKASGGAGPLYVVASAISGDTGSNTYVRTLTSLANAKVDLAGAREFPGWSDIQVIDGKVFVSSGEGAGVQRFSVDAQGKLVDDGDISFANYTDDAAMYLHAVISPTKAYLTNGWSDTSELVIWNPTTLKSRAPSPSQPSKKQAPLRRAAPPIAAKCCATASCFTWSTGSTGKTGR
ncbi:MAG: hypothetical protein QM756_09495 [Polyangiaceae bacterium]